MVYQPILVLVLLASLVHGQNSYDDPDGETGSNNATATATAQIDGETNNHVINVGSDAFFPNSIVANPEDTVTFVFHSGNHSVIQSLYGWPCIPQAAVTGQEGFHSGFFPITDTSAPEPTWNLTVNNNTDPIFFYCGAPGSCINKGMLGVINANADTNLTAQIELAKASRYMLEYDETMSPAESASVTALAAIVLAVPKTASSSLAAGAIAGIAIGAAAALVLVGILLFCLRRNKKLKKQLNSQSAASAVQYPPAMQQEHVPYFTPEDPRKSSLLPAYAPYVSSSEPPKSPESEMRARSLSPYLPYMSYRQDHRGRYERGVDNDEAAETLISHDRVSETSELGGDVPGARHELNAEPLSREDHGLGVGAAR